MGNFQHRLCRMLSSNSNMNKCQRRKWIKLFCSALVPISIGIFTVITTLQQQEFAKLQREFDQQVSNRQRQQDQEQSNELKYENIFVEYVEDVSKILKESPLKNISDNNLIYLRTKTLTALRRLNPERKKYIFLFLYESHLLSSNIKLDLSGADFTNMIIDPPITLENLHISGVYLSNSSFINCKIYKSNFSRSILMNIKLEKSLIHLSTFKDCSLNKTKDFNETKFNDVDFTNVIFIDIQFINAEIRSGKFSFSTLLNVKFNGTLFRGTTFHQSYIFNTDFRYADLTTTVFTKCNLNNSLFTDKQIAKNHFEYSIMPDGHFSSREKKNLIVNGDAKNCSLDHWKHINGIIVKKEIDGQCYFTSTNISKDNRVATMEQHIDVRNYSLLINLHKAKFNLSAKFNCSEKNVYVKGFFSTSNTLIFQLVTIESNNQQFAEGHLPKLTTLARFRVGFQLPSDNNTSHINNCLCDDIQFTIFESIN